MATDSAGNAIDLAAEVVAVLMDHEGGSLTRGGVAHILREQGFVFEDDELVRAVDQLKAKRRIIAIPAIPA